METVDEAAFIPSTHTSFRTAWEREQLKAMSRQLGEAGWESMLLVFQPHC